MKSTLASQQRRKPKSAYPSKKTSNTSSLIYKEITSQMEHLYEKNRVQKSSGLNTFTNTPMSGSYSRHERKQPIAVGEKYSLQNVKKKSSVVNIPPEIHPYQPQLRENLMLNYNKPIANKETFLERKSFKYQYIIGKGGFGKVWRVEHVKNRNQYAFKEMLKSLVMTKKSVQSVLNERTLLSDLNSPFMVNMHFAFQDRDALYLVLDLMEGGDLRYHIGNKNFNESQARFFVACIVLGLEYLHFNKIIHRDIKPENLVLDSRGYIRITDLGIARLMKNNNSADTSGTPGYMSPEVICRQNHGYVSDFFALGVIAYELMTGRRPYQGRSRAQIREQMLAKQVQVRSRDIPQDWNFGHQAADFINKLIQRKPENRLGASGISELKNHPWLRDLNWRKLAAKEIESPFIPNMRKNNFDQDDQITIQDQEEAQLIEKNSLLLRKPQFQELFKNYFFDGKKEREQIKIVKNNFFNENQIFGEKERQRQKISLKRHDPSMRNSKQRVVYKQNLETIDTVTKDIKRKGSNPGPYIQQKTFFKEFRF